jgi:hypothetical protein
MNAQDVSALLIAQPFQPFRLYLTDGCTFDVEHPDFMLVGKRTAHIYEDLDPATRIFKNYAVVSLLHITRAEPLETATSR